MLTKHNQHKAAKTLLSGKVHVSLLEATKYLVPAWGVRDAALALTAQITQCSLFYFNSLSIPRVHTATEEKEDYFHHSAAF